MAELLAREPAEQHRGDVLSPGHLDRATGVHHHDGAWAGGRDGPDEVVLATGEGERGAVEALGLDPVGGADDDHRDVGVAGQLGGAGALDLVGLAGASAPKVSVAMSIAAAAGS